MQIGTAEWARQFTGTMSETLNLRVPSGRTYIVTTYVKDEYYFFCRGWDVFASDYSIKDGDYGVFTYHSDIEFKVRIFRNCGMEKYNTYVQGTGIYTHKTSFFQNIVYDSPRYYKCRR